MLFYFVEQLEFNAQLSWAWNFFITSGPGLGSIPLASSYSLDLDPGPDYLHAANWAVAVCIYDKKQFFNDMAFNIAFWF